MASDLPQGEQILQHVEDARAWYDRNAKRNMHWFQRLRAVSLAVTILIPVLLLLPGPSLTWKIVAGLFGATAAFCQGLEGIHQYHEHYLAWRSTAERIEHEQFQYKAGIGPYTPTATNDPIHLLAQRVDALTTQENQQWVAQQQKSLPGSAAEGGSS